MPSVDIDNTFEALYLNFLLKDLLAKIAPGSLILITMSSVVFGLAEVANYISNYSFWTWIIFSTFSWTVGFAIQSIGEYFNLVKYHPDNIDDSTWYTIQTKFEKRATKHEAKLFERFDIISESCGNGYISLFISAFLLLVDKTITTLSSSSGYIFIKTIYFQSPIIVLLIIFIYFLRRMHLENVQRRYNFALLVIDSNRVSSLEKTK